ncbi:hypothetical protein Tco_1378125 [Tanacetum coccineum]
MSSGKRFIKTKKSSTIYATSDEVLSFNVVSPTTTVAGEKLVARLSFSCNGFMIRADPEIFDALGEVVKKCPD